MTVNDSHYDIRPHSPHRQHSPHSHKQVTFKRYGILAQIIDTSSDMMSMLATNTSPSPLKIQHISKKKKRSRLQL